MNKKIQTLPVDKVNKRDNLSVDEFRTLLKELAPWWLDETYLNKRTKNGVNGLNGLNGVNGTNGVKRRKSSKSVLNQVPDTKEKGL